MRSAAFKPVATEIQLLHYVFQRDRVGNIPLSGPRRFYYYGYKARHAPVGYFQFLEVASFKIIHV